MKVVVNVIAINCEILRDTGEATAQTCNPAWILGASLKTHWHVLWGTIPWHLVPRFATRL